MLAYNLAFFPAMQAGCTGIPAHNTSVRRKGDERDIRDSVNQQTGTKVSWKLTVGFGHSGHAFRVIEHAAGCASPVDLCKAAAARLGPARRLPLRSDCPDAGHCERPQTNTPDDAAVSLLYLNQQRLAVLIWRKIGSTG